MRKIFALIILWPLCLLATDVTFNVANFVSGPMTNRPVYITPRAAPFGYGTNIITGDRLRFTSPTNTGTFVVSNLVPWLYDVEIKGAYADGKFSILVPNTNSINAVDCVAKMTNVNGLAIWFSGTPAEGRFMRAATNSDLASAFLTSDGTNHYWTAVAPGGGVSEAYVTAAIATRQPTNGNLTTLADSSSEQLENLTDWRDTPISTLDGLQAASTNLDRWSEVPTNVLGTAALNMGAERTNLVAASTNGVLSYLNQAAWPATNSSPWVFAGGDTNMAAAYGDQWNIGYTVINTNQASRIRQTGFIRAVSSDMFSSGTCQFQVFRQAGSYYVVVATSETLTSADGSNYWVLATPMPCQEGDFLGIYGITGAWSVHTRPLTGWGHLYVAGAVTTSNQFASRIDGAVVKIAAWIDAPVLAVAGDSILGGWNCGNYFWGYLDAIGTMGEPNSTPAYRARTVYGMGVSYRNFAVGGVSLNSVDAAQMTAITNMGCQVLWIGDGVNDAGWVFNREWPDYETNLNSIRAKWPRGRPLLVAEILPWNDGQTNSWAVKTRAWNTNIATWCASNDATCVRLHDRFGVLRPSTGYLDDTNPALFSDGVHLSQAGVDLYASIMAEYARSFWTQHSNSVYTVIAPALDGKVAGTSGTAANLTINNSTNTGVTWFGTNQVLIIGTNLVITNGLGLNVIITPNGCVGIKKIPSSSFPVDINGNLAASGELYTILLSLSDNALMRGPANGVLSLMNGSQDSFDGIVLGTNSVAAGYAVGYPRLNRSLAGITITDQAKTMTPTNYVNAAGFISTNFAVNQVQFNNPSNTWLINGYRGRVCLSLTNTWYLTNSVVTTNTSLTWSCQRWKPGTNQLSVSVSAGLMTLSLGGTNFLPSTGDFVFDVVNP